MMGRDDDAATMAVFDVVLHPGPKVAMAGPVHRDAWGTWPTIMLSRDAFAGTTTVSFDEALAGLDAKGRAFVEPDGAFVWVGPGGPKHWQVDGNAWEREGRVHAVDAKGSCPLAALHRFLEVWRGPEERLAVELIRAGVHLDEPTFLRHAVARGAGGIPARP